MSQQEMVKKLQENSQQAKQFNSVAEIVNEAVRKEMPVFMKLVQFDVLTAIQKKAVADNLTNNNPGEKELSEVLDKIFGQINKDLEKEITKKFADLKKVSV